MATGLKPWEIHPALTAERLLIIGQLIRDVRSAVALRMERDKGDTLWGAGCSAYERTKFAISKAAVEQYAEWLSVSEEDHHFLIKIGLVPIRFYRSSGEPDVPAKYTIQSPAEQAALAFAFSLSDTPTPGFLFRIEVETDYESHPVRVTLWQVDQHGQKHNEYLIPKRLGRTLRVAPEKKPRIEVPRPVVGSLFPADVEPVNRTELGGPTA